LPGGGDRGPFPGPGFGAPRSGGGGGALINTFLADI
jgi:hypothetical protein